MMVVILGLFIFPFVIGHLNAFTNTITQYRLGVNNVWAINQIDQHGYNEVGLFKFFRSTQIDILHKVQLITTFLGPVIFLGFAGFFAPQKKIIIGLCSLKFSLVFFYNFIDMPFNYLFLPAILISYFIAFYALSQNSRDKGLLT